MTGLIELLYVFERDGSSSVPLFFYMPAHLIEAMRIICREQLFLSWKLIFSLVFSGVQDV